MASTLPHLDALPYYDRELEDKAGLRARVEREIQAELKKAGPPPTDDERLPAEVTLFKDRPELAAELERVAKKESLDALDRTRYQLPAPSDAASKEPTAASEEDWAAAVRNAETQLMHADARLTNLELLKKYGANLWRLHNFQQEALLRQSNSAVESLRTSTQELNRSRKTQQTEAGEKLSRLEARWAELISKNLTLEVANLGGENEVAALEEQVRLLEMRLKEMDG